MFDYWQVRLAAVLIAAWGAWYCGRKAMVWQAEDNWGSIPPLEAVIAGDLGGVAGVATLVGAAVFGAWCYRIGLWVFLGE